MEDKHFKDVTCQAGKLCVITSVVQATEFIVSEWPGDDMVKLDITKHALVECFDGKRSPGVARMAFIEAAKHESKPLSMETELKRFRKKKDV